MLANQENLPRLLYHGSRFKQPELMPGFNRSGKLVQWDETESNLFLYASSVKDVAIELGFASAIEKLFNVTRFRVENKEITIETELSISQNDLAHAPVYLYTIACQAKDGWKKNNNEHNGIDTEFKTQRTILNILQCERVDIKEWLKQYQVTLKNTGNTQGVALEAFTPPPSYAW